MRVYSTSPEKVEEEYPFDEEKVITILEYEHEPPRNYSESRDDASMQQEEMNEEEKERPFDEENIIEIKEPARNHLESSCNDAGMQQNTIDRDLIEILVSLSSLTDRSATKNDNSITDGKLKWHDELAAYVFTKARNVENLGVIDAKRNTEERDDMSSLNSQYAFPKSPTEIEDKESRISSEVKESSNRCKTVQNTETQKGKEELKRKKKLRKKKIPNEDKIRERIIQKDIDARLPSRLKMRLEVLANISVNLMEEEDKVRGGINPKVDDAPQKIPSKPKMRLEVLAGVSASLFE